MRRLWHGLVCGSARGQGLCKRVDIDRPPGLLHAVAVLRRDQLEPIVVLEDRER